MASPSVNYTFANSTTADATQVNSNFTDIINAMTDGAKDFHIGSLNVEGATTLDGSVTLGDTTADDLTFTGSIASTIPYKTNATYNIGAATLAPLSIYLGNGTKSTRLMAGTVGTSYTITFPDNVSSLGQGGFFDASGVMLFRYPEKFTASKTADYTATGDETIIPCAPASSMTVTLPAASTMTGKTLTIVKTDTDITKTITIDANGTETILPSVQAGNLTYILYTQYESVTLKCDGTSWYVIAHKCDTPWVNAGAMAITATGTSCAKGTVTTDKFWWARRGSEILFRYDYVQTVAGTSGTGAYSIALPTGLTMDANIVNNGQATTSLLGSVLGYGNGANSASGGATQARAIGVKAWSTTAFYIVMNPYVSSSSDTYLVQIWGGSTTGVVINAWALNSTNLILNASGTIPMSGWNP